MTDKQVRIHELAKEYKVSSQAMLKIIQDLKFLPKSHMSVATPEMITAVRQKFAQEKQEAKKEMEHKVQVKEARERMAPATITAGTPAAAPAPEARPLVIEPSRPTMQFTAGKRTRRDKKNKKRERQRVDQAEVAKSFKTTMANLSTGRARKRSYHDDDEGGGGTATASNVVDVSEFMTVAELANVVDRKPVELVAKLLELGMMATINQRLDMDTIEMVAGEFGFEIRRQQEIGEDAREEEHSDALVKRAPVVTVMGHVDHGKTTLLDYVRKTNVAAGEAGLITQHIGAYEVTHDDERIVFLDTPGHEAFTAMRARGTQLTDIVVLVVGADEGVMPQTIEAIDHARAAGVPIIAAITKIDKPTANVESVRAQLSKQGLLAEEWGGQTTMVEVSAKSGLGVDKLLDLIVLQAELMDLKADPTIRAQGVVVDARLEKGRGPVTTVLIQRGTCRKGDPIVAGTWSGRIRAIMDDRERSLNEVGPSTPAQITGLNGVPQAGDSFLAVKDDQEAKEISLKRSQIKREYDFRRPTGVTLDKVFDQIREGQMKEVRLVIKGDVDGSVEALSDTLGRIQNDEVKVSIIRHGVGGITESDVLLAAASSAIIIGFQVAPDARAREIARREHVDVRLYDIIYDAENDVRKALEGLLSPTLTDKFVGMAEVRNVFRVPKAGMVAGTYVKEGRITRRDKVRVVRDGKVIWNGQIGSLKRFKDDAREVKEGFECGIGLENFNDVKVGDLIEAFEVVETARTLS